MTYVAHHHHFDQVKISEGSLKARRALRVVAMIPLFLGVAFILLTAGTYEFFTNEKDWSD